MLVVLVNGDIFTKEILQNLKTFIKMLRIIKALESILSTDCYTCNKKMVEVKFSYGQAAREFWIIEFLFSDKNLAKMVRMKYILLNDQFNKKTLTRNASRTFTATTTA